MATIAPKPPITPVADNVLNSMSATTRDTVFGTAEEATAAAAVEHARATAEAAAASKAAAEAKTAAEAAAAAKVAENAGSKGVKSLKNAGESLQEGGKSIWAAVKEMTVGGAGNAKGAVGGVAGFLKGTGDKALRVVGGIGNMAGKTAQAFPKLTVVTGIVAAGLAVRGFMKKRDQEQELQGLKNANELVETKINNDQVAANMPQYNNPNTRSDWAAKYGNREQPIAR